MSNIYAFNKNIAKKYGVNEAILIHRLVFYIEKNMVNNKHFYDGNFWIYNSRRAWVELFDFYSESQMKTILQNLIKKSAVKTGNYNKYGYDRTTWYSIIDYEIFKEYDIDIEKYINNQLVNNACSIGEISPIEERELTNRRERINLTIPEESRAYTKPTPKEEGSGFLKNSQGEYTKAYDNNIDDSVYDINTNTYTHKQENTKVYDNKIQNNSDKTEEVLDKKRYPYGFKITQFLKEQLGENKSYYINSFVNFIYDELDKVRDLKDAKAYTLSLINRYKKDFRKFTYGYGEGFEVRGNVPF